jgi:hypothetical protein
MWLGLLTSQILTANVSPYIARRTLSRQIIGTSSSIDFKFLTALKFQFIFISIHYMPPLNTPALLVPQIIIVSSPLLQICIAPLNLRGFYTLWNSEPGWRGSPNFSFLGGPSVDNVIRALEIATLPLSFLNPLNKLKN